jgi:predicted O-methyltransferase YrrM
VDIVGQEIERYALEHTTPPTPAMVELARDARATLTSPQMLSGLVVGRLLEMLVSALGARRVLEIGTYAGYSALAMAAALPPDGRVITCEISQERAEFARRHITVSPYSDRIEVRVGPALDTIAGLEGQFDLVFIDADKTGYAGYYEAVLGMLSERGLIVVDNTLMGGRVLDGARAEGESVRALVAFNDALVRDERVVCVMLTVRDGVTLIRRR